jgi:hypothetical protein
MITARTPAFAALRRGKQNFLAVALVVAGLTYRILANKMAGEGCKPTEPNP